MSQTHQHSHRPIATSVLFSDEPQTFMKESPITKAIQELRRVARLEHVNGIAKALYESDHIMVIGDGCTSRARDTQIIAHIICAHLESLNDQGRATQPEEKR